MRRKEGRGQNKSIPNSVSNQFPAPRQFFKTGLHSPPNYVIILLRGFFVLHCCQSGSLYLPITHCNEKLSILKLLQFACRLRFFNQYSQSFFFLISYNFTQICTYLTPNIIAPTVALYVTLFYRSCMYYIFIC